MVRWIWDTLVCVTGHLKSMNCKLAVCWKTWLAISPLERQEVTGTSQVGLVGSQWGLAVSQVTLVLWCTVKGLAFSINSLWELERWLVIQLLSTDASVMTFWTSRWCPLIPYDLVYSECLKRNEVNEAIKILFNYFFVYWMLFINRMMIYNIN